MERVARGQFLRKERAKQASRESRMQTANAIVSSGRLARDSMLCTSGTEELVREVEEGMRFVRWVAAPAGYISLSSNSHSRSQQGSWELFGRVTYRKVVDQLPHPERGSLVMVDELCSQM